MSRRVIRTDVQSLIGGVSQQPAAIRPENQCDIQDNAFSSVIDGLGKRQPTEFISVLSALDNTDPAVASKISSDSLVHWITKDKGEQYLVVGDSNIGSTPIKVFDLADGTEMTVTGADGGSVTTSTQDYLKGNIPELAVTGATQAAPIVITVSSTDSLSNDRQVTIAGVTGNTAANGTWSIKVLNDTTFSLTGSESNGAYVSGGTVNGLYSNGTAREYLKATTIGGSTYILNNAVITRAEAGTPTDSYDVTPAATTRDYRSKSSRRCFLTLAYSNLLTKYAVRLTTKTGANHAHISDTIEPPQSDADHKARSIAWVKTNNGDASKRSHGNALSDPKWNTDSGDTGGFQVLSRTPTDILCDLYHELGIPEAYGTPPVQEAPSPHTTPMTTVFHGGIEDVYDRERQRLTSGGLVRGSTLSSVITTEDYRDERDRNKDVTFKFFGTGSTYDHPEKARWSKDITIAPLAGNVMMFELKELTDTSSNDAYRTEIKLEVIHDGEDGLFTFSDSVQRLDQLPLICKHGHRVKITGLVEGESETGDDWYVEFVKSSTSTTDSKELDDGYWKESCASGIQTDIDASTMPHQLERVVDGSQPNGYRFELKPASWKSQESGDKETNPDPHFIGRTIENLFFWRNRLGVLTGTHVVFSEADDYTNFYRTTVRQVIDSDPIDLDAGHTMVAKLRTAVSTDEVLVVFTNNAQFVVRGEPILSPKTASIRLSTEYQNIPGVDPVGMENGVFYSHIAGSGGYSGVKQLVTADLSRSLRQIDSSGQIPRYITGNITRMAATSIESALAVTTDDAESGHILYVHKWFDRGDERLLSSWMRFLLGPGTTDTNGLQHTQIVGMTFVENDLYLLMRRYKQEASISNGDIWFSLEKVRFTGIRQPDIYPLAGDPAASDAARGTYRTLLDRRITENDCTISYDTTSESVFIDLPWKAQSDGSGTASTVVISRVNSTTNAIPEGRQYSHTISGGRITIPDQDQSIKTALDDGTLSLFIGQSYEMLYQFSEFVLKDTKSTGARGEVATGRYQLIRGVLTYEDSGGMTVRVAPALHSDGTPIVARDNRDYILPPMEVGLGRSHIGDVNIRDGRMSFFIQSTPDKARVQIINATPYPCNPKAMALEGTYTRKSTPFRA